MKIIMGADFNAVSLKEAVRKMLVEEGHEVVDVGVTDPKNPTKGYFQIAPEVAKGIQSGEYEKGFLFCGTGMGMAILANKFQGVYAAVCESTFAAEKARAINNANILTMGAFILGEKLACDMAKVFLATNVGDGLEDWRKENVKKAVPALQELEKTLF